MFPVGVADQSPISLRRQAMMRQVAVRRKKLTTHAERKLLFHFGIMNAELGGIARYQREKTIHIADMLSRSLDFYFSCSKVCVEADGSSHSGEINQAKDAWADSLIAQHLNVVTLRFSNEVILGSVHVVINAVATSLRDRHNWPKRIARNFDAVIRASETEESWLALGDHWMQKRRGSETTEASSGSFHP